MNRFINLAIAVLIAALVSPPARTVAAESDALASARDLYAAAEYEHALELLNRLPAEGEGGDSLRAISEYRAYCLLALGRSAEAERAIAAVVMAAPLYQPPSSSVSPRVRSAFRDVRRRLLPEIIRTKYAAAKAMFDAREFTQARDAFGVVLATLADPEVASLEGQSGLADLGTLAVGFRDLSISATPAPALAARPLPVSVATWTAATASPIAEPRLYTVDDPGVVAPAAIRQTFPPFEFRTETPRTGVLDLVIDETGAVETAVMRVSVTLQYDQLLLAATTKWRFAPATVDGSPVRYRRLVQVSVQSSSSQ